VVGEDSPFELLRTVRLELHLPLQPLGDARHPREREVVLGHLVAEVGSGRFHQRFGVGLLDAADEEADETAEQASDAGKHVVISFWQP
jgi:hypothetical protein